LNNFDIYKGIFYLLGLEIFYFCYSSMFEHMNKIPLIDHKSNVPLHIQAEEHLGKLIASPEYMGGRQFPRETDLARRWSISRNTLA